MLQTLRNRLVTLTALAIFLTSLAIAAMLVWGSLASHNSGSADSANTLVVARNLLERGRYEVDYLGYFFYDWASLRHPEDSFPLLQPTLVAAMSWPSGDVMLGGALYQGLMSWLLLGGVPLLLLRDRGPIAGVVCFSLLLAFEAKHSVLMQFTNDGGACAFAGLGLVLFAGERMTRGSMGGARFWGGTALLALAALHKTSAGFVALGVCAALLLDARLPWGQRLRRGLAFSAVIVAAQLPFAFWTLQHLGEFGAPHNAPGRLFVRSIAHEDNYENLWEAFRTYWPSHPDRLAATGLREAVLRALRALELGVPALLPLPWLAVFALYLRGSLVSRWLRTTALILGAALLLPLYSHFEQRYFYPLRPAIAIALGMVAARAAKSFAFERHWLLLALAAAMVAVWLPLPRLIRAGNGLGFGLGLLAAALVGLVGRKRPDWRRARSAFALVAVMVPTLLTTSAIKSSLLDLFYAPQEPHLTAARLIEDATQRDEVVMSRRVWNLNLHTRRPGVMIPFDTEDVCTVALRYGASVLVFDERDAPRFGGLREFLAPMPVRAQRDGVTLYELACGPPTREPQSTK